MTAAIQVDPAVSREPLPATAQNLPTICVLCSHNCGLLVDVEDGRITALRPDQSSLSAGYICSKASSIAWTINHSQRVEHPLRRRKDGGFDRITWDEAISEIAAKLTSIRDQHGGNAIGFVGGGGQANHLASMYGLPLLAALGSRRWYNSYAQEKSQHHLMDQWMFDAPPSTVLHADVEGAPLLVVMGTNPRISNRGPNPTITFNELRRAEGRQLIVVDPRETETSAQADYHLRVQPGGDAFLLLGICKTLVEEDLIDHSFVADKTSGYERIVQSLSAVDIAAMAGLSGLPESEIRQAARTIAQAPAVSIMYDLAVEQTWFSTLISYLIRVVLVLTGNIGRTGSNYFLEGFNPPVRSKNRFSEPERSVVAGVPAIRALGNFAMISPNVVPEEILTDDPRRLRAIVVENANPWLAYADTPRWREAREKLDLMIVVEPAMTETAAVADYVLPAAVGYEKWEWAGFAKGHFPEIATQLRPPVVPPPGEALPEPEIYARLAEAAGIFGNPPAELHTLAEKALQPEGVDAYVEALRQAATERAGRAAGICSQFWAYRTLGPHLPGPGPAALFLRCMENGVRRREAVIRALEKHSGDGSDSNSEGKWDKLGPAQLGLEIFRHMLAHPEGTVIAIVEGDDNLGRNVGWEDGRIRLAPEPMLAEIQRAVHFEPPTDENYPLLLASGLRTRWTANAIHRDPRWRRGKGPHCSLHISPADAEQLGIANGQKVALQTRRGTLELPAEIDEKLLAGHVWVPNGFGVVYPDPETNQPAMQGVNLNEITDAQDRDPISGCPHHKVIPCRVEPVGVTTAV